MGDAFDLVSDVGVDTELFFEFATQRVTGLFAHFDLSAGEFPFQRFGLVAGALTDKDLVFANHNAGNDTDHAFSAAARCSMYWPTIPAQASTSLRSSSLKRAGSWLSISISPTTRP